jgi:hypothetical protein
MNYLECHGTPREVGRQQGETLREMIQQRWAADIAPLRAKALEQNPAAATHLARIHAAMLGFAAGVAPDLIEEMRGLGEGCGLAWDDILTMSTYNSLLFAGEKGRIFADEIAAPDGCTGLAFERSPAGPFLMKTYDPFGSPKIDSVAKRRALAEKENHTLYVVRIAYEGGPRMLGTRMAGSIWTECGVNDAGFAFASASLHPRLGPQSAAGLPQHFLGSLVANHSRSTAEAVSLLRRTPVFGKGYAMALGDDGGDVMGVEKTGPYTGLNPAEKGIAFQTNHIRSADLLPVARSQNPAFFAGNYHRNSAARVARIEEQREAWAAEGDFDRLVASLFHAGTPGDVIQNCTEPCQFWITTWAALVFPEQRAMWVAEGLPEERQFQKWKL